MFEATETSDTCHGAFPEATLQSQCFLDGQDVLRRDLVDKGTHVLR